MSNEGRIWFVENIWTCSSCRASNRGRDINCSKCGVRKPPDAEEVIPESPQRIIDQDLLSKASAGPNWICQYCKGQERNAKGECTNCGGPKQYDQEITITSGEQAQRLVSEAKLIEHLERSNPNPSTIDEDIYPHPLWRREVIGPVLGWQVGLIVLAFGSLIWFFIWLFTPKELNTKVSSIVWEYAVNLREQQIKHDSDWHRPGNKGFYEEAAFNVECHAKYYGTESCHPYQCHPHQISYSCNCTSYRCNCSTSCSKNGNGFSTCSEKCSTCTRCDTCYKTEYDICYEQCSVYKDWCEYDYYDWPITQTKKTSGSDHKVYWPDLEASNQKQRIQKVETYKVKFANSEDEFDYVPNNLPDFTRFNVGELWTLQVGKIRGHNIEKLSKAQAEKE